MEIRDIDIIIPAKASSERVPSKNWREFFDGKSLVSITIDKLLEHGAEPSRIYVSCEKSHVALPVCKDRRVKFLSRHRSLCSNDVPLTTWVREITNQVGADVIGWAQVTSPFFNQYSEMASLLVEPHDSVVACFPWRGYLMGSDHNPIGWGFSDGHVPSQQLPQMYTMPFAFSVLTRESIRATGYHVGVNPVWFAADCPTVDIDTELDFQYAKFVMARHFV